MDWPLPIEMLKSDVASDEDIYLNYQDSLSNMEAFIQLCTLLDSKTWTTSELNEMLAQATDLMSVLAIRSAGADAAHPLYTPSDLRQQAEDIYDGVIPGTP